MGKLVSDKEFVDVVPAAQSAEELSGASVQGEDPLLKVCLGVKVQEM